MVVLGTAVLGGCSAEDDAHPGEEDAPAAAAAGRPPTTPTPTDDAGVCTAFGDVATIVENADLGLADGRMAEQERDGWYGLASRVLGRLPSGGDSAVQTAVGDLQEAAPAIAPGAYARSTGVGSAAWSQAQADLAAACDELGAPWAIGVFTGG